MVNESDALAAAVHCGLVFTVVKLPRASNVLALNKTITLTRVETAKAISALEWSKQTPHDKAVI